MRRILAFAVVIAIALTSCRPAGGDDVVASAYGNQLLRADIEGLVPEGTSPDDSIAIITNYVNQWLQQQVVLEKARKNVKKNFDKELQNYKNSLMAYEYEQMVVEQLLDTNVSDEELQAYYDANRELFILRFPIERSISLRLPSDTPSLPQLRKITAKASLSDADMETLQRAAASYAVDSDFDFDAWKPIHQPVDDEATVTLTHVIDRRQAGEVAPIEYEREAIRSVILNRRKIDIIKNMQRDLLKEAVAKGQIVIKDNE